MKKILLVVVLVLSFITGFSLSGGTKAAVAADEITIAVLPMFIGHPWFVRCEMGAKKAAEEKHVDTPVAGKANILIGHMATVPAGILSGWIRFASPESVISVLTDGKSWHPFLLAGMSGKQIEQTLAFCEVE